jgi:IS5 family transposase
VEEILMAHYTVGTSREGADAYPPLMLLKGLLLEKWYRIDSDPELEWRTEQKFPPYERH